MEKAQTEYFVLFGGLVGPENICEFSREELKELWASVISLLLPHQTRINGPTDVMCSVT